MTTTKVSEYKNHLSKFHKKIIADHDPLLISGQDGNVVILPKDDYKNLIETLYILCDKTTIKSLEKTRNEVAKNKTFGTDLKKTFSDVMEN